MVFMLGDNMANEEPPLLEELGVNFGHIKTKVSSPQPARELKC
jgi:hypothetical protein